MSKKALTLNWAAGFFEGEGNAIVRVDKRHTKKYSSLVLQVAQVHREPLDAFTALVGYGTVRGPYGPYQTNKQAYYQYQVSGVDAAIVATRLIPLLFQKGEQVSAALAEYRKYKDGVSG